MGRNDPLNLKWVGAPHECPLGSVASYRIYADVRFHTLMTHNHDRPCGRDATKDVVARLEDGSFYPYHLCHDYHLLKLWGRRRWRVHSPRKQVVRVWLRACTVSPRLSLLFHAAVNRPEPGEKTADSPALNIVNPYHTKLNTFPIYVFVGTITLS